MNAPTSSFLERVHSGFTPLANPDAIVQRNHVRFTVLTPRFIRLEWSPTDTFDNRGSYTFPNRYQSSPPSFTVTEEDGALHLKTEALELIYTGNGETFTADNLSITFQDASQPLWRPGMVDTRNVLGTYRTLDTIDGSVALKDGLLSRSGWTIIDDSTTVRFSMSDEWVESPPDAPYIDWYCLNYGHNYKGALQEYTRFSGQVPLIPRYVLGAWWSRYWAYSAQDLKDIVTAFDNHDLPLDVLVVDMDWHKPDSWTGYTWNRDLFPDPQGFLHWVHEHGLRTTLNLHPAEGVQAFEDAYPSFAKVLGADISQGKPVPFHVEDRAFMQHYFELLHHPLEEEGVDFWWMDWQQGQKSELAGLDPLLWLNHLHFLDSARRGQRPMLYSRYGGLGSHRYHIGFSGDTFATWGSLQFQPYFTATAANVCYGWWSHDIGGHVGADEPELFARWVQFGALSPCLRLHATKDPLAERRPWTFPEPILAASQAAFHLRYQLTPYLYTMARVAADTSVALCRPMYYEHPADDTAYIARDQYYLGDQLIAAPITTPADPTTGIAAITVWVPAGTWLDMQTGEELVGPRWVQLTGDITRMPLLIQAGGIIPFAPVVARTDNLPKDILQLRVFPYPGASGDFRYYEDDGTSLAYEQQQYEWTGLHVVSIGKDTYRVTVDAVEGHCDALPDERGVTLLIDNVAAVTSVLVNGTVSDDWSYASPLRQLTITIPAYAKKESLQVEFIAPIQTVTYDTGTPHWYVQEYLVSSDMYHQLGHLIIAACNTPFDVQLTWSFTVHNETQTQDMVLQQQVNDLVLPVPFVVNTDLTPQQWQVTGTISWQGGQQTINHRSPVFFPSVSNWQLLIVPTNTVLLDSVMDHSGKVESNQPWQTIPVDHFPVRQLQSIQTTDIDLYQDQHQAVVHSGGTLTAFVAATLFSYSAHAGRLHFVARDGCVVYWNGQKISVTPESIMGSDRVRETEIVQINAGYNYLLLKTERPRSWHWYVGCMVVAADGSPLLDITYPMTLPGIS